MKRTAVLLAVILVCLAGYAAADYGVIDRGAWPENWPKELEPLRAQARTLDGPLGPQLHYAIPFDNREQFETAWPHLLKIKGKNEPLVLSRGADFFLGEGRTAGVIVHSPLATQNQRGAKAAKEDGQGGGDEVDANYYLVLVVDGDIVDLNRIPLPADTKIVDKRFDDQDKAPAAATSP